MYTRDKLSSAEFIMWKNLFSTHYLSALPQDMLMDKWDELTEVVFFHTHRLSIPE